MKQSFLIYIIALSGLLAVSCRDDLTYNSGRDNMEESGKYLSVEIDIPEERTRAIDMTNGAPVYLQKVWIGIYDKETGKRVGGTPLEEGKDFDLQNRLTPAGQVIKNLIPVDFYEDPTVIVPEFNSTNKLCVVGVANYDPHDENLDIMTNKSKGEKLIEALREADTWKKFKEIAIDTRSEGFVNQTPMLMGYLYNPNKITKDFVYTKIDQFADDEKIKLICRSGEGEDLAEPIWITAQKNNEGKWALKSENYQLRLRRLRSKINVEFVPYPGVTIKSLSYQVHNKPNSVYLGQRLTDDFTKNESLDNATYSPNSADRNIADEENGYTNDQEWIVPENIESFSFEHFENKHWVRPRYDFNDNDGKPDYHKREANDLKGTFHALADNADDWNNKASYFILNMSIEDTNTGRNADVKYVVHEGYCNDQYGNALASGDADRLKDYQCIRNTNYTYRIQVRGVNDIVVYVENNSSSTHPTDHGGSVWQMKYIGMNKINPDGSLKKYPDSEKEIWSNQIKSYKEEIIDCSENPISFPDAKVEDIAFRLVGQAKDDDKDEDETVAPGYSDVCFNFRRGELDGFKNLWPEPSESTHYLVNTDAGESPLQSLRDFSDEQARKMLSKIELSYEGSDGFKNIKEYIEAIYEAKIVLPITGFKFLGLHKNDLGSYYDDSNPRNNIRALYIFDREKAILNGLRVPTDKDEDIVVGKDEKGNDIYHECSFLYEMVAAEQLPYDPNEVDVELPEDPDKPTITFGAEDMIWTDQRVDMLSTSGLDSRHWFGGTEVATLMYWKHKEGIKGYTIQIYDPVKNGGELKTGTYEKMYLSETDIARYLGDDNILTVPFTTTRYSEQSYDVWITPEFDNEIVANEPWTEPLKLQGALYIQENRVSGLTTWNFNTEPWKSLKKTTFTERPLEYNGLMVLNKTGDGTMPDGTGNYIQFRTAGSSIDKCFWFYVHEPVKITVSVSNTNTSTDRYLQLYREVNGEEELVDNTKNIGSSTSSNDIFYTVSPPVNPDYDENADPDDISRKVHPYIPTKYILYCNNNCRYYKITLTRTR